MHFFSTIITAIVVIAPVASAVPAPTLESRQTRPSNRLVSDQYYKIINNVAGTFLTIDEKTNQVTSNTTSDQRTQIWQISSYRGNYIIRSLKISRYLMADYDPNVYGIQVEAVTEKPNLPGHQWKLQSLNGGYYRYNFSLFKFQCLFWL